MFHAMLALNPKWVDVRHSGEEEADASEQGHDIASKYRSVYGEVGLSTGILFRT